MRFSIVLGIVLMVLAFVALFLFVLLPTITPDSPLVLNILETFVCDPGQRAEVRVIVSHDSDGTGYTPDLTCIAQGGEGERIDASAKHFGIGMISFIVPFLIGLFMTIAGAQRATRNTPRPQAQWKEGSVPQQIGFSAGTARPRVTIDTSSGAVTLKAKLKELEDARSAGLLTREEFETLRQEILDKLA